MEDYFDQPLVDLGLGEPAFAGIFTPAPEVGAARQGITDQFLADGAEYHRKYSNAPYFRGLFEKAFAACGRPAGERLTILDIGTGPGVNTIQPCLELFPACRIIATDLSPPLLGILRSYVTAAGLEDHVACVCTDAMRNYFKPAAFDLVVGTAILHHLMDPAEALRSARRALKPGGMAIFVEPFEGFVLLRVMFETILARAEREGLALDPKVSGVMAAFNLDFRYRMGRDKSDPAFQVMDDKWLFTRAYLDEARKAAGFSSFDLVSAHDCDNQLFRRLVLEMVEMGAGVLAQDIPAWAWEEIDRFDRCLSRDLKEDLAFEGVIVLRA
ncbi:MAG: class I SAM-dependent methyltransferase [Phenylobacterium sp.]